MNRVSTLTALNLLLVFLFTSLPLKAQLVDEMGDESSLYAETKQVNQFFRRFNGEEDKKGNRYYPKDKKYRNRQLRKNYLINLFDESNQGISRALKKDFITVAIDEEDPCYLDFHGIDWFAEVHTIFLRQGKEIPVTLFMDLEEENEGYKWVISQVSADYLMQDYPEESKEPKKFLHPLSHELGFMNLRKALENKQEVDQYLAKDFQPDQLTLFLQDLKKGTVRFKTTKSIQFHFFQMGGWYFEVSYFNRPGYNRGWLISNLVALNDPVNDRAALETFIGYEK